ncbi:MAG: flagellar hook protein FlgE [Pigmentiphaga sp.]|nr:flagellar hook protein FlgE [Pigmentiphaga sp.]
MGFGQGLSGLNAASQTLDVIGNNIANSGTAGFKGASAKFADIYASSSIGLGVQTTAISQNFKVGNLESTGNQYDIAIDGPTGFFRLVDTNGEILFSRNGQFLKDKDHYIVNAQGQQLTGYPPGLVGANPVPLQIPVGNVAPMATDKIQATLNLNGNQDPIPPTVDFNPERPDTFNTAVPATVYDSLGNSHQLTQYFVKRDPESIEAEVPNPDYDPQDPNSERVITVTMLVSVWEVQYALGETVLDAGGEPFKLYFDSAGRQVTTGVNPTTPTTANLLFSDPGRPGSPTEALTIAVDYAGSTQFGSPFTQNIIPNGYASGEFVSVAFAEDGTIVANFTNGQTSIVGTLVLANFNNIQGLTPKGGNAWAESPTSGPAILGQPGSNGMSVVMGQAVEMSNVDLSQELVNLIIAQRTYQANAQTISTQDQILQTLMQMR